MANKITQKDYYKAIIAYLNGQDCPLEIDEMTDFCEDRIEKLSRKSGGSKKPTKTQIENEGVKDTIVEVLGEIAPATATAIATDPRVGVSNQKVTALLKQLVTDGKVVRTEDKGKALFSVAVEE